MKTGQPVISVDTKKKEIVGEFANGERMAPHRQAHAAKAHDFVDKDLGRAVPYGVYDLANDGGWVSVGDTADTTSFTVKAIRRWWSRWESLGSPLPPSCSSPPMPGGPTATGSSSGRSSWPS